MTSTLSWSTTRNSSMYVWSPIVTLSVAEPVDVMVLSSPARCTVVLLRVWGLMMQPLMKFADARVSRAAWSSLPTSSVCTWGS
ncbi:hypothetical protein MTP99_004443 [Tenebrio molitor]|nr:hypothetical protein MTP99_004443 [Tenebrio molitor]